MFYHKGIHSIRCGLITCARGGGVRGRGGEGEILLIIDVFFMENVFWMEIDVFCTLVYCDLFLMVK